ncbi:D-alanine--D-alanine ligase family protein [Cellulomonas bogoriensis]|uniref:D-alanine--D-alanine ligase n=1 Tax=Cellulomonas bogoriensis 69B4 = DSM 16987 TaxID=1386082 RepID=A0A0A0C117_9CELL|nr:D-alanine--D-alanine ligase [Cellulomonas bogoriensis]KGM13865.1 D-alanine--D-alanine ligase [Cellulomonas bogoriensis 69B4 = DSM 16987]
MSRTRVAVVGGGRSSEHHVSLASAAGIRAALDPYRYAVLGLTIEQDGGWSTADRVRLPYGAVDAARILSAVDVVIPALHGPRGEDGTFAGFMDVLGVPCTGSGVRAGALAMDKWATKLVAAELGIATAPGVLVTAAQALDVLGPGPGAGVELPVVVKPVAAGSSHGVTLVTDVAGLGPAVAAALALDDRVLLEQVVRGREVDVAVLERPDGELVVSPGLEIRLRHGAAFFDTAGKYDGGADLVTPADLPAPVSADLGEAARTLYRALGCAGVARFDFFVTDSGVVLNEVNTSPGFTPRSQVPRMFAAAGIGYGRLLDLMIRSALVRGPQRGTSVSSVASGRQANLTGA